jgi:hypothetical protein
MSYLHHRANSKPIHRRNAEKMLKRVETELHVLIDHAPTAPEMSVTVQSAKLSVRDALLTIKALYSGDPQ